MYYLNNLYYKNLFLLIKVNNLTLKLCYKYFKYLIRFYFINKIIFNIIFL